MAAWFNKTFRFIESLNINAGLRFNRFYNQYDNKLAGDRTFPRIGYKANANVLNPKLNFYYHMSDKTEF